MLNSRTPIQSQSARFLAGGPEKRHGVILIYPDELTIVAISTDTWAYILGPGAWREGGQLARAPRRRPGRARPRRARHGGGITVRPAEPGLEG
jgi:hypothetical protein